MISADAPVFFAKACELFILDLTMRAFMHTQDNKRKTLQVRPPPFPFSLSFPLLVAVLSKV